MAISKSKRRYSVSLTPANVKRFQSLCKQIGLPQSTMSTSFDDFLHTLSGTLEEALAKGSLSVTDLFTLMGKQLELSMEENKKEESHEHKRKAKGVEEKM